MTRHAGRRGSWTMSELNRVVPSIAKTSAKAVAHTRAYVCRGRRVILPAERLNTHNHEHPSDRVGRAIGRRFHCCVCRELRW